MVCQVNTKTESVSSAAAGKAIVKAQAHNLVAQHCVRGDAVEQQALLTGCIAKQGWTARKRIYCGRLQLRAMLRVCDAVQHLPSLGAVAFPQHGVLYPLHPLHLNVSWPLPVNAQLIQQLSNLVIRYIQISLHVEVSIASTTNAPLG